MHIRPLALADVPGVVAIEGGSLSPWSAGQVLAELQRKGGYALVGESSSGVVSGWCCGVSAGGEGELLKITVSRRSRGHGQGSALVLALCRKLAGRGARQVFLEVRSRNEPALGLYARLGFVEVGRRNSYYSAPIDDALVMALGEVGLVATGAIFNKT